jgi:hypothetical protein
MLAESWDGTNWTILSTPSPAGATVASLSAVSCSAVGACTGVGGYATSGTFPNKTLADRWDGTAWTIQTTPTPNGFATFAADSCAGATACTAVGSFFAEAWSGTTWAPQALAQPRSAGGSLAGVSCTAAAACTAGGSVMIEYVIAPIFANSNYVNLVPVPLAERYS